MSVALDAESALEDEAYQRNTQTAADFPPGTCVRLANDPHMPLWVDSRHADGSLTLEYLNRAKLHLTADQLWRIDPTR